MRYSNETETEYMERKLKEEKQTQFRQNAAFENAMLRLKQIQNDDDGDDPPRTKKKVLKMRKRRL